MKKDFTITIIKILKWITLFILTFITVGIILYMLNNDPFSDWLISIKIYQIYCSFSSFIKPVLAFFIVGILILLIPYTIVSIWLGANFLIKYIQQKRNIVKKQIPLRVSPALYAELMKWAEDDFRSLNGQIEYLLTECVRRRKGKEE